MSGPETAQVTWGLVGLAQEPTAYNEEHKAGPRSVLEAVPGSCENWKKATPLLEVERAVQS